jgi:hypothetical protein
MLKTDFQKFQLSREQMRTVYAGDATIEPGGPDGECKTGKCKLNGSESPCSQFDRQAGRWNCSWCCAPKL